MLRATVMALILAASFNINIYEWIAIIFVFTMELINSAIENLIDFVSLEKHETIRKIKDLVAPLF